MNEKREYQCPECGSTAMRAYLTYAVDLDANGEPTGDENRFPPDDASFVACMDCGGEGSLADFRQVKSELRLIG